MNYYSLVNLVNKIYKYNKYPFKYLNLCYENVRDQLNRFLYTLMTKLKEFK